MRRVMALLALAMVAAGKDPVGGNPEYVPPVGAKAVLHYFDKVSGMVDEEHNAWLSTAALAKYCETMEGPAYRKAREKVLGNKKALGDLSYEQRHALHVASEKRGELIALPDMTELRVLGLSTFLAPERPSEPTSILSRIFVPTDAFVEITSGRHKGKWAWVSSDSLRVPDSKPFVAVKPFDFSATPSRGFADVEAEPDPRASGSSPKLMLESSNWSRQSDYVRVDFRVKNLTGDTVERIYAKVVFEDASGKVLTSGTAIVGDLRAGEAKTAFTFDQHNPRMDHYVFEFEGKDDEGKRGGLEFTTPDASRQPPRKARRK